MPGPILIALRRCDLCLRPKSPGRPGGRPLRYGFEIPVGDGVLDVPPPQRGGKIPRCPPQKKQQDQPAFTAVIARSEATWQSPGSWHALKIGGITTPQLRLAMTEVDGDWSFYFRWRSNRLVGGGNAARPTIRIPYAERKPATGREILLVCRQAQPIRHALGSRPCRASQ